MPRQLPTHPSLDYIKKQAKELLRAHGARDPSACGTLRRLRQFADVPDDRILDTPIALADAQFALALDYGFSGWTELTAHVARATGGPVMTTARTPDDLDTELAGKPASQRTPAELIPLLAAMSARALKAMKPGSSDCPCAEEPRLSALESSIDRVDEDLLRTGLKPLVDGADREIVLDIVTTRKRTLLQNYERRLDLIIAGLEGISAGNSPMLIREKCKAML